MGLEEEMEEVVTVVGAGVEEMVAAVMAVAVKAAETVVARVQRPAGL